MADQLLSQADVDALVASLSKNEPPKVTPPMAAKPAPVQPARASFSVPAPPPQTEAPSTAVSRPLAAQPPVRTTAPSPAANPAPRPAPARVQAKPEVNNDQVNILNTRVAELTKQLNNMQTALKRMEMLERKVNELEAKTAQPRESPATAQKVQKLSEEMQKIVTNLKGTPGYGVRNSFTCEKCDDHGHVAVQFRCTSCGSERWYGWWPSKK